MVEKAWRADILEFGTVNQHFFYNIKNGQYHQEVN
jgi:hypothetical protein